MTDLSSEVLSHLDPAQAEAAIQQAMPLLIGGLAKNASTAQGADVLHSVLGDHAGNNVAGILGSVLGSSGSGRRRTLRRAAVAVVISNYFYY